MLSNIEYWPVLVPVWKWYNSLPGTVWFVWHEREQNRHCGLTAVEVVGSSFPSSTGLKNKIWEIWKMKNPDEENIKVVGPMLSNNKGLLRAPVPSWGQTTQDLSVFSPIRDCGFNSISSRSAPSTQTMSAVRVQDPEILEELGVSRVLNAGKTDIQVESKALNTAILEVTVISKASEIEMQSLLTCGVGVCLHIKLFFPPVDRQHSRCLCRFTNPKKIPGTSYQVCGQKTASQRHYIDTRYAVCRADNVMFWHHAGYLKHDIHILWKRYSMKQRKNKYKEKRKNRRKNRRAPPLVMWQTLQNNDLNKQHHYIWS